ncbi:Chondroadherin-like protein like [Argiope bruennichi]|uniref:Chondroadherin-like protein like n=1 Tax=Argiope bruennichi TaxID=94029 RepID=A0A8T0E5H4_ARGBR|nr:Chondroadherin-like protein like [Argiope bruennichi]
MTLPGALLLLWALLPFGAPECVFLRDDQTIRCWNSTLPELTESLHVLTAVVRNRPRALEAEWCNGTETDGHLPLLPFDGSAVERIRLRRCGLRTAEEKAFESVALSLKELDFSYNQLEFIPEAIRLLVVLEHLDLSHNLIAQIPPGGPLSALNKLKELELGHNRIGNNEEEDTLPKEGINSGLLFLGLRANGLKSIPTHLQAMELLALDLSENDIEQVGKLPRNLQSLDLHANRLRGVPFDALSDSIQSLDLTENPLHCDCALRWMHEWANENEIQIGPCYTPPHLEGRTLDEVPWDTECPDHNATFRYMARGHGDASDVVYLSNTETSITVAWRTRDTRSGRWTVVYRREEDSPYQMTLAPEGRQTAADLTTQILQGLQPGTRYVICLAQVSQARYTVEVGKCAHATTQSRPIAWTELETVAASAAAVSVSWILRSSDLTDDVSYRHEWTVRLRRVGSESFTDVPVYDITTGSETDGQRYEYALGDLAPRTRYEVCLVDVEHRSLEGNPLTPPSNSSSCATVQTSGHHVLQGAEIAAVAFACILCIIVCAITIILCYQKKLLRCQHRTQSMSKTPPPVEPETPPFRSKERDCFAGSWNALSRSYAEFNAVPRPQFSSFRTLGYRDALTTVTIYSSGYSEC